MTDDRTEWLAWRHAGIGASDMAGIAGLSPWTSPLSVWVDKTGPVTDEADDLDQLRLGRDLEPLIAAWYEHHHRDRGLLVWNRQARLEHHEHPWARCTLDGTVHDGTAGGCVSDAVAVWEAKYTADGPWDEIPIQYQCQAQWAMWITGLPTAVFAVLHLRFGRPDFQVYELERDKRSIDMLVDLAERFWHDHVQTGVAPDADDSAATTTALAMAWPHPNRTPPVDLDDMAVDINTWRELKAAKKAVEADLRAVENRLKRALGDHTEGHVAGRLAVSWRHNQIVADEAVRRDHGDKYDRPVVELDTDAVRRDHGKSYDTDGTRVLRHHQKKETT